MNGGNLFRAIRGPVLLITVGVLFALDHMDVLSFDRTWPAIIIIFGLMKLAERMGGGAPPYPPQYMGPPSPYAGVQPYPGAPPYAGPQQPGAPPSNPVVREGNPQ
jgi:hypothetical protein